MTAGVAHRAAGSDPPHGLPGLLEACLEPEADVGHPASTGGLLHRHEHNVGDTGHSTELNRQHFGDPSAEARTVDELLASADRACASAAGAECAAEAARGDLNSAQAALLAARAAHAALQNAGVSVPGAATEAAVAAALAAVEVRGAMTSPREISSAMRYAFAQGFERRVQLERCHLKLCGAGQGGEAASSACCSAGRCRTS